jgi:hypothetical protein
MNYTTKDIFKGTFIQEAKLRSIIYDRIENKNKHKLDEAFIEDNMSKWPVIVINFKNVSFDSKILIKDEIIK